MKLREKDLITLLNLENIGKKIQRIYMNLEQGDSEEICSEALLKLVDRETEMIYSLDIDSKTLRDIEAWYKEKADIDLDSQLLLGIKNDLSDKNYPYYRIIARLRYLLSKQSDDIRTMMDAYATDTEVELLYFVLTKEAKSLIDNKDKTKEETISRNLTSKMFISYAHNILINSIEAEVNILKNDMTPPDIVYDCIDFHSDIISYSSYKNLRDFDENYYNSVIDEMNLNDRNRSTNVFRIPRFNKKYKELMQKLISQIMIYKDAVITNADFLKDVAYVKTLVAALKKDTREKVYKNILSFSRVRSSKLTWLKDWLIEQFQDIENNLVPRTQNVALIPYFGAK